MQEEEKWDEVFKRLDSMEREIIDLGDAFVELVDWCRRTLPSKYVDDYIKHLKAEIRNLKKKEKEG